VADTGKITLQLKDWGEVDVEAATARGELVAPAEVILDCPEEMCHEDVLRLLERAVAFLRSCWARAAVEKCDSGVRAEAVVPDISLPLDREGYLFLIHQLHGALLMQGIYSDDKEPPGAARVRAARVDARDCRGAGGGGCGLAFAGKFKSGNAP
jgi:hypothetical protein